MSNCNWRRHLAVAGHDATKNTDDYRHREVTKSLIYDLKSATLPSHLTSALLIPYFTCKVYLIPDTPLFVFVSSRAVEASSFFILVSSKISFSTFWAASVLFCKNSSELDTLKILLVCGPSKFKGQPEICCYLFWSYFLNERIVAQLTCGRSWTHF